MPALLRPLSLIAAALLVACSASPEPQTKVKADAGVSDDAGAPTNEEPGAESNDELCSNGTDDDDNEYADCDDFWCRDSVAVTVCGALENTDELCSNGVDDVETPLGKPKSDGLVDCADPDCLKNPAVGVCPPLAWELGAASCSDGKDNDGDELIDCADPDCLHAGASDCALGSKKRVLFDNAHRQRAGSADWIVDSTGRHPWPSVPAAERDWAGALSAFGKDLMAGRFVVETLPPGSRFAFGDGSAQDLANYSVLVVVEPSSEITPAEASAILGFVRAGGGLLLVADHAESDRDGNGWDSVRAFNEMFRAAGEGNLEANPFGFSVAPVGYSESGRIEGLNGRVASAIEASSSEHPVLKGAHGEVTRVGMNKGGLFAIHDATKAKTLLHAMPLGTAGYEQGSPYVVAAEVGKGRVVAIGDSSIFNDGTDSHGIADSSLDSWHHAQQHNASLVLNAVEWLAR
ncbi:MAG: DUF4350 domain-containing protein [Myxococcales bacterium]|jgi:hypothetical protein